jgi:hypothetical protein
MKAKEKKIKFKSPLIEQEKRKQAVSGNKYEREKEKLDPETPNPNDATLSNLVQVGS